ncbi:hypothetical protein IEQ34_005919 [Dendrobium chrysotoxum]|uniref:NADH:ubiquinone reductase (non-electrogenic) n=1 Tax=Dendrobium chrysotoxum TaxID=161865 RepID=A0AAV7HB36_DENCH|nr:hypothetical protein IEQ34_005919 [Dendrobium chrysotoxum]
MAWLRVLARLSRPSSKFPFSPPPPSFSTAAASFPATQPPSPVAGYIAGLGPTVQARRSRAWWCWIWWAGCRLMKSIDTNIYDVVCVSTEESHGVHPTACFNLRRNPRVSFRCGAHWSDSACISHAPGSYFFLARCAALDPESHTVHCETVTDGTISLEPWKFQVSYDKLVIALGAEASTFGINGVKEHATFLREVHHAQEIRRKLLLNLMLSDVPGISEEEKRRLLHCVVIGGGPTGVEFSGELSDFIISDVHERYTHVKEYIHVTLIEANEILSSFDVRLRQYATKQLTKSGVRLVRGVVKDVQPENIILNDGTKVPYGLLVWSTGVGPSQFTRSLELPKSPGGRIGVDEWLRVPSIQDTFAIGDCSGFLESTQKTVLPALAQVAERQGKYLARLLNQIGKAGGGYANQAKNIDFGDQFVYKHLGSMATVGRYKALVDLRQSKEAKGLSLAGFVSWFIWRSAYLTRVVSWRNRFYVAINWLTTLVFGRDISRI